MSISTSTAAVTNDIYERIHHLDAGLSTVCNTLETVQEETTRAASGIDDSERRFDNMV
jgi:flagellin-like hook-associated protein FlgL